MADNDASVVRRATLSTLPLEIKSRICELAALQDERYKERWVAGAPGEKLVKVHKNEWRGRSLAALSETSKEFNQLAAKHIFHTLTDTQIESVQFTLVVLARHSFRVRRVVINSRQVNSVAATAAVQRIFAALPLLPNLSDLHITHDRATRALGDLEAPGTGESGVIRDAFRPVARRLHKLALMHFPTADSVVPFLEMCGALCDLTISGPAIRDDPQRLGEHLSTVATLERLTLDATNIGYHGLHLPPGWPTLHTLSSLSLINIQLDATNVAFIDQHALTLRHLTLGLPEDSPPTPPPGFPTFSPLPSLSTFTLRNSSSTAYEGIIAALAVATSTPSSPATSQICHLDVELSNAGKGFNSDHIRASLRPFKGLRSLCMTGRRRGLLSRGCVGALNSFQETGQLSPWSSRSDPFLSRSKPAKFKSGQTKDLNYSIKIRREAISAALAHGERLSKSYAQEENMDGLELLLNSLGNIWGHKLLEDD